MVENEEKKGKKQELPPGFRFDPTDEELVFDFLYPKLVALSPSSSSSHPHHNLIPELDFHAFSDPYQLILQGAAFQSYGQWYFFTRRTENRVTQNGYWVGVAMGQPVFARNSNKLVGLKKSLEFYVGKFPTGVRTGWLMQEYHMCSNVTRGDLRHKSRRKQPDINKWVLCRIQETCDNSNPLSILHEGDESSNEIELSYLDEVFLSINDDYDEISSAY